MIRILFASLLLVSFSARSQNYAVSLIPDSVKEKANSVVREYSEEFIANSTTDVVHRERTVITILNKTAQGDANFNVHYDVNLSKVTSMYGEIFDRFGKSIRKLKKSEILDLPTFESFESDNRQKIIDLEHDEFPYTVVFEYEKKDNYLMFTPRFIPVIGQHRGIQQSSLSIKIHKQIGFRYKNLNIEEPIKGSEGELETYFWESKNLKPISIKPYTSGYLDMVPYVITAPNQFNYDGYAGDMSSWSSFAAWVSNLLKETKPLSEANKKDVQSLVAGVTDKREIVELVYEHLQSTTRYISVQLGIGGFKPIIPDLVKSNGYGDCKALTFYTKSMLQAVGVDSYYTTIYGGSNPPTLFTDFPSQQFNHVILAVPVEQDTLWLECTSQDNPVGFLGSFTSDRYALLINGENSKLVKTTSYSLEDSYSQNEASVTINDDGSANVQSTSVFKGLSYERVEHLADKPERIQSEWLKNNLGIPSFELSSFNIETRKGPIPELDIEAEILIRRHAKISGKRIFLPISLMDVNESKIKPDPERTEDLVIRKLYSDIDVVTYNVPANLYVEHAPDPVKISTEFADFELFAEVDQGKIIVRRRIEVRPGTYKPEKFNELVDFYNTVRKSDKAKIVLVNKT